MSTTDAAAADCISRPAHYDSGKPQKFHRAAWRYASLLWLLFPAAVTALLGGHSHLAPVISVSYVLAVSAAAWWGGIIPGILASCATIPVLTLVVSRGRAIFPAHLDIVALAMLFFISILVSTVAKSRKRVEQVLRTANEELEAKVAERTAALQEANTELQYRLAELESLYSGLPSGVCVLDAGLRFVRINEKLAALNGAPASAHIGRELREIVPGALADLLEPLYRQVFETGKPILDFEINDPTMPNSPAQRSWSVMFAPVAASSGTTIGVQCIVQDITDRKRTERAVRDANEELRRLNGDLQQFAFSASHDLQEPLRTLAIYSQLLAKRYGSKLDENGQLFLEYVTAAAKRMEMLVRDLLNYVLTASTEESGEETADAGQALCAVLEGLSAAANESGARISYDVLPAVKMRSVHLQQIFQNLIGNAIKYRSAEPPRIHVAAHQQDGQWVFSVQDNGIGIDSAYTDRIFGIFKRLHTADQYSGTGIGLAICKRIVERYDGRIWVESEAGNGATFFFTLPA